MRRRKERDLHDDIKYNNQIDPQEDVNNQHGLLPNASTSKTSRYGR